ncbi:opioid growth factor receptor-like protein 1 isoform X2 [Podarcis raffonei]|uniref:opioid growth factor receptor-like protein 1 isoform X2 n=1 Tax=Podarcis raffonei TaxID=65483 RepID=UPI00232950AA|nr:opioid growth factor receptor-like protein 1 isoform X2 [Podarcis raffonei]
MGSLLSGVSFKEPTTVEDCDSTWETDSEPELQDSGGEEGTPLEGLGGGEEGGGGGGGDPAEDEQQQQQGEPLPAASCRPEDTEPREGLAEEPEEEELEEDEGDEEEEEGEDQEGGRHDEAEAASTEQCDSGAKLWLHHPCCCCYYHHHNILSRVKKEAAKYGFEVCGNQRRPRKQSTLAWQGDDAIEVAAKPKRSFYAARDLYKYRHQYPNFKDLRYQNDLCNLRFYKNKIPFKPDGVYIEEVLNKWKGDYEKLEHNHTYIQWLFPLREQGLNFYAKELTTYEIEEFKKTKEAIRRFLLAYKMMLEFFGIKLIDKTGNVARASNWQERFQHLNESQHNYLRITRILKSLGELGYESFKPPLVKFILHEALVEDTISNIKQSALEYFVYTIRDRRERRKLLRFAQQHYTPSDHFIWGPPRKQKLEGSKPSKKLASPVSLRSGYVSKPKSGRECKNVPVVCNSSGKATNEKRAEHAKKDDDCDRSRKHASPEVVKQSIGEKNSNADCQNSILEETANPSNQKENVCHLKKYKGKNDENLNQDCRNAELVEKDCHDCKSDSTNISTDLQDSVVKDKNPGGSNKEETRA